MFKIYTHQKIKFRLSSGNEYYHTAKNLIIYIYI
jgi:hypothetical protein